jgi:membrane-associated phospholipid phosphatase
MIEHSNHSPHWRTPLLFLAAGVAAVLLAQRLDRWAFYALHYPEIDDRDFGRMFRSMGFVPTWLLAGAAIALAGSGHRRRVGWRRAVAGGTLLALTALVAGGLAEVLKIAIRRERPITHDRPILPETLYVFRPWSSHFWETGNLGLPSSHSLIAFAAATILSHLYPRATPVWFALAVGCALTRVASQAHFASDATLGAVAGIALGWTFWHWAHWRLRRHDLAVLPHPLPASLRCGDPGEGKSR